LVLLLEAGHRGCGAAFPGCCHHMRACSSFAGCAATIPRRRTLVPPAASLSAGSSSSEEARPRLIRPNEPRFTRARRASMQGP
jgi:hypothetical protein